jgi:UDP-N-acetylglucosamine 2-epimerase
MIDSLVRLLPSAEKFPTNSFSKRYALVTLHRPSNVDDEESLKNILQSLVELSENLEIVFPVHPRTRQRLTDFGIVLQNFISPNPCPILSSLRFSAVLAWLSLTQVEFRKRRRIYKCPALHYAPIQNVRLPLAWEQTRWSVKI